MRPTTIIRTFRAAAAADPQRVALQSGERKFTYAELEKRAAAVAEVVQRDAPGDTVALLCGNTPECAWALLGALWAGKTVAVLPTLAPPPLLVGMCAEARIQTALATAELAPRLAEAKVAVVDVAQASSADPASVLEKQRAHEAAVLLYTSGSTGLPKAVALSDANVLANIEGCVHAMGFTRDEVMIAILPLFHAFGLTVTLLLPLTLSGSVILLERFAPRAVLQAIERHRGTALIAVPSQFRLMAKEPAAADLSSLKFCIAGAERLPENVAAEFRARFGVEILQGYGATEAAPVISINPRQANRAGSVGRPLPNLRVLIREGSEEVARGSEGEICVSGPNVMLGYVNRPDATAQKIIAAELRTGDRGYLDADGYLHISGRADDLIKIAGEKVYPAEVEAAIEQIAGVEEAAVVAVADATRGAALVAFVQPKAGEQLTEAALRSGLRQRLEGIKIPRTFNIVEQLPRTLTGKVDKKSLAKS